MANGRRSHAAKKAAWGSSGRHPGAGGHQAGGLPPRADSLAALVREQLKHDPFSGRIDIFRSKRADRLKILAWDGSGLVLLWKRPEHGAFRWPPISDGVMRLSA